MRQTTQQLALDVSGLQHQIEDTEQVPGRNRVQCIRYDRCQISGSRGVGDKKYFQIGMENMYTSDFFFLETSHINGACALPIAMCYCNQRLAGVWCEVRKCLPGAPQTPPFLAGHARFSRRGRGSWYRKPEPQPAVGCAVGPFLATTLFISKTTYLTLQHLLEYFWKKTHTQMWQFFLGTGKSPIGKRQTAAFLVADIISSESSTGSFTMSRILRPAEPREMEVVRREGSKCDKKGPGWLFGSFFYWRVRKKGDQILVIAILWSSAMK